MPMRVPLPQLPGSGRPRRLSPAALALAAALVLSGCEKKPSLESQRIDQLEFKLQQLETRLNKQAIQHPASGNAKQPAGRIKSLTYRTGSSENRLRIYWADGSQSDLECTQEQTTLACG
jgi:hypothetical protein